MKHLSSGEHISAKRMLLDEIKDMMWNMQNLNSEIIKVYND